MKRLFSILIILLTFTTLIFAKESYEPATDEDGFPDDMSMIQMVPETSF